MTVTMLPTARNVEDRLAHIQELRQRMHRIQGTAISNPLPTLPAFEPLVRMRTGSGYAVDRPGLAMALMAGPSRAGAWSAVIGVPDFGLEAAAGIGVDLDRTVLVPEPGDAWLEVTAALADVLQVVVVRPPGKVTQHQAARLSSRLRQRDAVLIAVGDWPRAEARLWIDGSIWTGIGRGHGRLTGHRASIIAESHSGQRQHAEVWLPAIDQQIRVAEQEIEPQSGRETDDLYVVRAG